MAFLLPVIGSSKSKGTIRKGEIDLHVNIEDDLLVYVNTKRILIAEQNLDLLAKCMEVILTKKANDQGLKVSPLSIYSKEKLHGLYKHQRTISENHICDVSLGDWCGI